MNPFDGIPDAPDFSDVQGGAASFSNPFDEVDPQEEARKRKKREEIAAAWGAAAKGQNEGLGRVPVPDTSFPSVVAAGVDLAGATAANANVGAANLPHLALAGTEEMIRRGTAPFREAARTGADNRKAAELAVARRLLLAGGVPSSPLSQDLLVNATSPAPSAVPDPLGPVATMTDGMQGEATQRLAEASTDLPTPLAAAGFWGSTTAGLMADASQYIGARASEPFGSGGSTVPITDALPDGPPAAAVDPAEAAYLARRAKVLPTIPGAEEPLFGPGAIQDALQPESKILQVGEHADDFSQDVALGLRARPEDAADAAELSRVSQAIDEHAAPSQPLQEPPSLAEIFGDRPGSPRIGADLPQKAPAGAEVPQIRPETAPESPQSEIGRKLAGVKALFRQPDSLGLWGVPYEMRPRQQPGDLWRAGNTKGWVYLGHPGWWGSLERSDQEAIKAFLEPYERAGLVPGSAYEWSRAADLPDLPAPGAISPRPGESAGGHSIDPPVGEVVGADSAMIPPPRPGTKALTNVAGMQSEFRDLVEKHADVIEAARGARVPATVWHDAQGLADDLGMTREDFLNSPGGRIFNAQEVSLAKHYMGGMKQEISDLSKKLAAGEIPEAERAAAVARLDSLNTDTVRMMAVVQKQFSEAGRTLRSGQELLDPFGGTPDLKAALVKRYSARAADEAAAAEAQALKKLTKDAAFEARKAARAAAKTDLSAEFADLSSQFGKLAGRPRMGLDPELVKLVGSLAKNRVKAGVNTLEEIVDQIYQAARPHFEDISPEDIKAAILQHTLGPKAPKPAGTPRLPSPDVALKEMVDPLSAGLTKRYGGLSDDVIQQIARLPDDPGDPALLNFLRSMERPTFRDYMGALSYHFMLSGPKSMVRNVLGNTVKRWTDLAMKPIEAGVEAPLARLQGRVPERFIQETLPAVVGNYRGASKGLEKALFVLKNGYDPERLVGELTGTGASKWETGGRLPLDPFLLSQNRLVRGIGRVTGYGPTIMNAGDVMAKARAATSANYAWATRKAIQDVRAGLASSVEDRAAQYLMDQPDEMLKFSEEAARKATYQDQMSAFGRAVSQLRRVPGPPGTMASYMMPFVHVSDRVGAFLLDFTPGARSLAIYKAAKEGSPVASDLIARQLVGSAFAAAATGWAFHGKLTGSMSRMDLKLRNDAYAAGKQPYSVLVGDRWVPIRDTFGGLAGPVVAAAAFHDQMTTGEPVDAAAIARAAGGSVIGEARYLLDASYLQSLSQAVSAIEASPDQAGQEAANLAARTGEGFYVPFSGLLRNVATARDPRVVDAQGPLDTFKSAIPGLRETLPAKLDSMGHELVANTGAAGGFLPFVPTRSTIADPQLADDVSRLRYTVGLHATGLNKAEKRQEAAWQAVDVAKPEDRARLLAQAQQLVADNPKADWAKWVRKQTDDVHKLEEELRQVKANAVISPAAKRKIELELDQQMKLILQGTLNALNQPQGAP